MQPRRRATFDAQDGVTMRAATNQSTLFRLNGTSVINQNKFRRSDQYGRWSRGLPLRKLFLITTAVIAVILIIFWFVFTWNLSSLVFKREGNYVKQSYASIGKEFEDTDQ